MRTESRRCRGKSAGCKEDHCEKAASDGIEKKDIVIDALAMTISSEPEGAKITLETLRRLRDEVGVCTVLGVSNISFGLPSRPIVNSIFYTMAMQND